MDTSRLAAATVTLAVAVAVAVAATCPDSQHCTTIYSCLGYQTKEAILAHRPQPCGFLRDTPFVCCPAVVPTTPAPPPPPLPTQRPPPPDKLPAVCGNPNRTVTEMFGPPPPLKPPPPCMEEDLFRCPLFVVGGYEAVQGKWPWMVLFGKVLADGSSGSWFCGGTLITPLHVLTAAHCLRPAQADGSVVARLGDHDRSVEYDVVHQDRTVSRVLQHPGYSGSQNDMALVWLSAPADVSTDTVQTICLPPAGAEHRDADVEVAGWGRLEFAGDTPDILQEAPLRVIDEDVCERTYRRVPSFAREFVGGFQGTKICTISRDGVPRDACSGDSGGPLMAPRPDGLYELVGVVSTGVGCGNPQFPGIYTKVSRYIGWILDSID